MKCRTAIKEKKRDKSHHLIITFFVFPNSLQVIFILLLSHQMFVEHVPSPHLLSPPLDPWQPLIFFILSIVLTFPECHAVGLLYYVDFSDWLLLHSNMHLSFLHVFMAHFFLFLFHYILNVSRNLFILC